MKPHQRIIWEEPGTSIAGRAYIRTFKVGYRALADEGWMERDEVTMSFSLPSQLAAKMREIGREVVTITYTGLKNGTKQFDVVRS